MSKEPDIRGISENLSESISAYALHDTNIRFADRLNGRKIAISVSESDDIESLGLSDNHLKDISIEIARYLIVSGATLLYGGDLRKAGYTQIFSELTNQYANIRDKTPRFVNYFSYPISESVTKEDRVNFKSKQIGIVCSNPSQHLQKMISDDIEVAIIYAEGLSEMRKEMNNIIDARIIIGGRLSGYRGYLPGIVEEALYAIESKKPIYFVGGFGGATKSIIDTMRGRKSNEFIDDTDSIAGLSKEFKERIYQMKYDSKSLLHFFQKQHIEEISTMNGLSIRENEILFESSNIHEIVFTIVKGLGKILGNSNPV